MNRREELSIARNHIDLEIENQKVNLAYFDSEPENKSGKPTVLCLHATGHGSGDFEPMINALAADFRIIALDWPDHGRSRASHLMPDYKTYSAVLEAFLAQLQLRHIVIIANSIGGGAALITAFRNPDICKKLVLCNPGGLQRVDTLSRLVVTAMVKMFRGAGRGRRLYQGLIRRYYTQYVLPLANQRARQILDAFNLQVDTYVNAWTGFKSSDADLRHLLLELESPVHFAWAKGDKFVSLARVRRQCLGFEDFSLKTYEGGHSPFLEQCEEFCEDFKLLMNEIL